MEATLRKQSLCLACAGLLFALSAVAGAEAVPSVLSRVQRVDDPDLGDLIRVAMERPGQAEDRLRTVRVVTESYAQIKLLDQQIEQLEARIASIRGPVEVLQELRLAKIELESRRIIELAKLREAMGVIPQHALGRKSLQDLKTWLALDVLGDRVYVLEHKQPFSGRSDERSYIPIGLWPEQQVYDYVARRLVRKDGLPIRIDIARTSDGVVLSQSLERGVIESIKGAGLLMDAEVHLDDVARQGHQEYRIILKQPCAPEPLGDGYGEYGYGEMMMDQMYEMEYQHMMGFMWGGGEERDDLTDANAIRQYVRDVLTGPGRLPARFIIEHDPANEDLAGEAVGAATDVAADLGLADFVQVTRTLIVPDPEERYLGKWQAAHGDEELELSIAPHQRAHFTIASRQSRPFVTTLLPYAGRWELSGDHGDEILVSWGSSSLSGRIDDDGNLVVDWEGRPLVFKKLD
jgi:hypothetical protein